MNVSFYPLPGYAFGAVQPSLIISFGGSFYIAPKFQHSLEALRDQLEEPTIISAEMTLGLGNGIDTLPELIVQTADRLAMLVGDQRFTHITWFNEGPNLQCAIPTLSPELIIWLIKTTIRAIDKQKSALSQQDCTKLAGFLKTKGRRFLPPGTNAASLIQSAAERKIPFKIFNKKLIILGYGAQSHILNSSLTHDESVIGVSLAKDKVTTNQFLALAGFPVAEQATVSSAEEAVNFADSRGYPIVLKPRAEEQGRGVHTFLSCVDDIQHAHDELKKTYKQIIAEKHYFGDGYRVYVLDDRVVRVRKLAAAQVIGDARQTIGQLIDQENANPLRGAIDASIKKIDVDDEVIAMLRKQSKSLTSVPIQGEKVILSPTTNLSRGGTSVDYFKQLHPANKKLCIDVTRTIGLKCSGVDLISVDASQPWFENNAIVCEVNAQPQIGFVGRVDVHDMIIDRAGVEMLPIRLSVGQEPSALKPALFDRSQQQLDVTVTAQSILKFGCPVQYFDQLNIDSDVPADQVERLNQRLKSVRSVARP